MPAFPEVLSPSLDGFVIDLYFHLDLLQYCRASHFFQLLFLLVCHFHTWGSHMVNFLDMETEYHHLEWKQKHSIRNVIHLQAYSGGVFSSQLILRSVQTVLDLIYICCKCIFVGIHTRISSQKFIVPNSNGSLHSDVKYVRVEIFTMESNSRVNVVKQLFSGNRCSIPEISATQHELSSIYEIPFEKKTYCCILISLSVVQTFR